MQKSSLVICSIYFCIFWIGCSSRQPAMKIVPGDPGPIDLYHQSAHPEEWEEATYSRSRFGTKGVDPLDALGIEQSPCYGACPNYTAIFCASGDAWYCGRANTKPLGCHTGRISKSNFNTISEAIEQLGFFELEDTYATYVTDDSSTLVFGSKNGVIKTVRDYAEGGPPNLWAIELLVGTIVDRVEWQPSHAKHFGLDVCGRTSDSR